MSLPSSLYFHLCLSISPSLPRFLPFSPPTPKFFLFALAPAAVNFAWHDEHKYRGTLCQHQQLPSRKTRLPPPPFSTHPPKKNIKKTFRGCFPPRHVTAFSRFINLKLAFLSLPIVFIKKKLRCRSKMWGVNILSLCDAIMKLVEEKVP